MIYLDNAATTKMSEKAGQVYRQVAEKFYANSNSLHDPGSDAKNVLEASRKAIAKLISGSERSLFFTGSGSEATFLALTALAMANESRGKHLITSKIEHSSVINTFHWLEKQGFEVTYIGIDNQGFVDISELKKAIRTDTTLASFQHVNSEIGTMQNLPRLSEICHDHDILIHSDCVQSFGKSPLDVQTMGLDALTISAHKIHGPKGLGVVWINHHLEWKPLLSGGTHERGFRSGTVDVPAIASFAAAADELTKNIPNQKDVYAKQRELFLNRLFEETDRMLEVIDPGNHSVPNIVALRTCQMEGQYAMLECSQQGLAISTGTACQVNEQKPSPVLLALGYSDEESRQLIRISLSKYTTNDELYEAAEILSDIVKKQNRYVMS